MSTPITSDGITRCTISLNGAPQKTIQLRQTGNSKASIVALQVDKHKHITSGSIIPPTQHIASFEFFNDGELWIFATDETTAAPLSMTGGELSFALGDTQISLEVVPTEFGSRDIKTDVKVKVPDEV